MNAGELRDRVQLFSITTTPDAAGDPQAAAILYATRWARVKQLGSTEKPQAAGADAFATHEVYLRACGAAKTTDRVDWRDQTLQVTSVVHDRREGSTTLLCTSTEAAD